MARRATVIKGEREQNKGLLLVLDAGGSLFGQWISLQSEGRVLIETMNALGYDALTIGRMELASGLEVLKAREKDAQFPFLSANLVMKVDQQPVVKPYTIIERQGARIGILGLSEPEANQAPGVPDKAIVLDPIATAKKYVPELRNQVDLLIVLSHLGLDPDKALAQAVPGIDIIIGGNTRQLMREPEIVGMTLIVQQGYRGEYVGRLEASFDEQGKPSKFREEIITLGPDFTDDPDMVKMLETWRQQYPSPTPRPTWTPDPNAPTPTPLRAQTRVAPTVQPTKQ